ncbi:MAG: DUF1700 domain-containing protein [Lachnospiraceae bacterium]|nr:DUF1700 domain-containing protein [Lachnospiraceae bacterium]
MDKTEFLRELERSLSGEMPTETVLENLQYYEGYFRSETAKGRSEKEVLDELGDPRLIARSIKDVVTAEEKEAGIWTPDMAFSGRGGYDEVVFDGYDEDGTEEYSEASNNGGMGRDNRPPRQPHFDEKLWVGWDLRFILITAAVVLTILVIAGFFFKAAIGLLTSKWFWITLFVWFAVRFIVRHIDMR